MKKKHLWKSRRQYSADGYPLSTMRARLTDAIKSVALVFFVTLAFAAPGRTATDDPFPIWWSAELELDSLDQVEARLRRDLWLDFPEGLKLYKEQGSGHVTAQARNCNSLKELSEEGYYGGNSSNIGVQHYHRSVCRAIALLGQAKPARTSYLRGFVLNAEAVHYLPALVNLQPSCQAICQAYYKNKRGVPLTDFEDIERVEVTNEIELVVWTAIWRTTMMLVARGDFTADGLDDILHVSHGGATGGTYAAANLYVLTRDKPGAVLRVIDAKQYLCPRYTGCW